MVVTARDAQIEGVPLDVLTENHRGRFIAAIERYRNERQPEHLLHLIWLDVVVAQFPCWSPAWRVTGNRTASTLLLSGDGWQP